uniref:Uncharacterized protein n=1 Tax=Colobus angolensis palliatus TaxID=336983 RepID=A0A2K5HGR9_COLAP
LGTTQLRPVVSSSQNWEVCFPWEDLSALRGTWASARMHVCVYTHTHAHTHTCLGSTPPQQELESPCPVLFSVERVELRWGDRTEQSRRREAELLCSFYSRKWGLGGRVEGQGWEQEQNRKPPHSLAFPLPSLAAHGARISMGTIKEAGGLISTMDPYTGSAWWFSLHTKDRN